MTKAPYHTMIYDRKTSFKLTRRQAVRLQKLANRWKQSQSEVIRNLIDLHYNEQ